MVQPSSDISQGTFVYSYRTNSKSFIIRVLDSRKKPLQLWSVSSSSRSPCRSCSVSFIKLSIQSHRFISQRWGRRSKCIWILTLTRSQPKSTAAVVPPTILSSTSSTRCSSEYKQRKALHVSIRNDSNLRILLASINGLLPSILKLSKPLQAPSCGFLCSICRAKNNSLETIESWANYKNHSEEWSGELWTGRAEDIHYDRLGLKHCKL